MSSEIGKYDPEQCEVIYSTGINWIWFYVKCLGDFAVFRLHMEDKAVGISLNL